MAEQDWPAGAYYGKLGDTVGYRSGGKAYIRSYVKPRTPQTPDAIASRRRFTMASNAAKTALNLTGRHGGYGHPPGGEYPQRLGQSNKALAEGSSTVGILPLYMPGTASDYGISSVSIATEYQTDCILSMITATEPQQADSWLACIYRMIDSGMEIWQSYTCEYDDGTWRFWIRDDGRIRIGDTYGVTAWRRDDTVDPYLHTADYAAAVIPA